MRKIKALIIDDSALMRQILTTVLGEDPEIDVVGTASNPLIAREKIKLLKPDVLTLDIEMPGMDGITFLEKLMRLHPLPVVMISSQTEKGATATLRALDLGAVDFVAKPHSGLRDGLSPELMEEIRTKVRSAADAHVRPAMELPPIPRAIAKHVVSTESIGESREGIIVMGASAGGTQAISEIMAKLPGNLPGIAIVQHMPAKFTTSFAERLNAISNVEVREAKNGDRLQSGVALVAPGGHHMAVFRVSEGYAVRVFSGEPVNRHCPAVDVLFESAAQVCGANTLGILLTGMGSDGAQGLRALRKKGSITVAQDEKTCVVFGMPDQAIRLGAATHVLGLGRIAEFIEQWSEPSASGKSDSQTN